MKDVYAIQYPDDTVYIGSGKTMSLRKAQHKYSIKCGHIKGKKTYVHFKLEKLGFKNCLFWLLETVEDKHALGCEKLYIEYFGEMAINKTRNPLRQNKGVKRDESVVKRINKTRAEKMPYFLVKTKNGDMVVLTNSYDIASKITGQCKDGLRKKVKYKNPCNKFNYEYVAGGMS